MATEGAAPVATPPGPSPAPNEQTPTQTPAASPPETGTSDDEEVRDPQALLRSYKALQERQKTQASRLTQLEAERRQAEDAKLSEQERLTKRVAELEAAEQTRARTTQERILGYEIKLGAAELKIIDPGAAAKLLDAAAIEYDADGHPTNIDKVLKALVKEKPYLVAAVAPAPQQPASVTNPASRSASVTSTTRYSQAELADREFYMAHREDIIRAHREGRIDP